MVKNRCERNPATYIFKTVTGNIKSKIPDVYNEASAKEKTKSVTDVMK